MPIFAFEFLFLAILGVVFAYGLLMFVDPDKWFELVDWLCRTEIFSSSYRTNKPARLQWRATGITLVCICVYVFISVLRASEPTARPRLISTVLLRLAWLIASITLVLWPNWWLRGHGRWRPAYSTRIFEARWPPIFLRFVGIVSALMAIMISTTPK